jgi:hypothetical protein
MILLYSGVEKDEEEKMPTMENLKLKKKTS